MPVSYTHLDVYKRQHTECALSEGKAGAQQAHPYAQHSEEKYQKDEQHRLCAGARGIAQVHCGAHQNKQQQPQWTSQWIR